MVSSPVSAVPIRSVVPTDAKDYSQIPEAHPLPNLIRLLLDSYTWFVDTGLKELFEEISPIEDFTGNRM